MRQLQKLVSREAEKKRLLRALESDKPELVALIGRRRVGKTFLVRKTYDAHIKIEITGLQNNNQKTQLQTF